MQTGLLNGKGAKTRTELQTAFNDFTCQNYEVVTPPSGGGGLLFGYTNVSFPMGYVPVEADIMSVSYFDNYVWQTETTGYNFDPLTAFHEQGLTKGLMTGMLSRNIETNDWLKTVNYFDYRSKLIQSFFKNHKGNIERSETQYRFNGEVLKFRIEHEGINEIYDYEYNHLGNKKSFRHTKDGTVKNVSKYEYDEINRLKTKKLGSSELINSVDSGSWNSTNIWQNNLLPTINDVIRINAGHNVTINYGEAGSAGSLFNAGTLNTYGQLKLGVLPLNSVANDLQTIDYSYHIRGLRGINLDGNNNLTNKLFSMRLDYETAGFYDGNIGKQEWKSSLDNVTRSFGYSYDGANRILGALYDGNGDENYSLENMSYDKNGNILTLNRKGKTGTNSWGDIDQLSYIYESNSNKIKAVSDLQGLANQNVGDFRDSSNVTTEYEYWLDGSLKIDKNKKVSNIDYNYLKLPKQITFEGGQWIKNQYDATGKKLKSTTSDGIIYDFLGNIIYKNDVLYQINHDEGRIVNGSYEYDIKDHLGNLRVSFRDSSGIAKISTKLDYDPWGLTLKGLDYSNPIFNKNNFTFLGREDLPEVGLVDLQKRLYDKVLGRFISVDPSPDVAGQESLSTYQYSWNNPVLRSDPNGDCPNCVTGGIGAGIGAILGGGIEAATQLYQHGAVNDWKAVGGAALQGGITGGAAGFTGGASLFVTAGVSAGANVVGGAINNSIQGKANTVQSVAIDATVGAVAGAGGKVLDKVLSKAEGIVYLRTNPKTGAEYVGQAKSAAHFEARQAAHDSKLGVKHFYDKIGKADPGTKLDVAEESAIRARGGANNKSNPNGTLENKRYQMNEERYRAAGGKVDKPN